MSSGKIQTSILPFATNNNVYLNEVKQNDPSVTLQLSLLLSKVVELIIYVGLAKHIANGYQNNAGTILQRFTLYFFTFS